MRREHKSYIELWILGGLLAVIAVRSKLASLFSKNPILRHPINKSNKNNRVLWYGQLFNLYAEYIKRNAGLEETQTGIKIAGRNINNLRYADDTTLMAESEEELKSLLMKVKVESEKVA